MVKVKLLLPLSPAVHFPHFSSRVSARPPPLPIIRRYYDPMQFYYWFLEQLCSQTFLSFVICKDEFLSLPSPKGGLQALPADGNVRNL